jgi:hypothetical protein
MALHFRRLAALVPLLIVAAALACPPPEPGEEMPLGVFITPDAPVVTVGGELQLTATAFYDGGDTADVTATATWTVVSGGAAEVSNGLDSEGEVAGLFEGTASVQAAVGDVTSEAVLVRVTDAEIVEISVSPTFLELQVGETGFLAAQGVFSDGSRGDVTGTVRWITGNASVCTVAQDGKVTGAGTGSTQVRTEFEQIVSNSAAVEVVGTSDDDDTGDDDTGDDDTGDDDTGDDDTGDDDDSLPNLEVTYFDAYVDADAGQTLFLIDVTNTGGSSAEIFFVDLFVDDFQPQIGDDGDETGLLEDLGPGQTQYADFTVDEVPDYWEWWSYVILDTTDDVTESDENDNITGPLEVWPP